MIVPKSTLLLVAWVFLSLASAAHAADIKARVAAIDLEKGTIALTAADQEQSYEMAKDCKVYQKSGGRKDSEYVEARGGLKAINVGDDVTATTDPVDGHEQVTRLKIESVRKKGRHPGRDISGKVAVIDAEKRTIGLSKTDKKQTYELAKDCNVYKLVGNGSQAAFHSGSRRTKRSQRGRRGRAESRQAGRSGAGDLHRDWRKKKRTQPLATFLPSEEVYELLSHVH